MAVIETGPTRQSREAARQLVRANAAVRAHGFLIEGGMGHGAPQNAHARNFARRGARRA